jgi:hypothetical protein
MAEPVKSTVSGESQDSGVPTPTFSENPASPTSGLSPEAVAELSKALLPQIEDVIDRKFKSTTDKRFSQLEKGKSALKDVLAELKAQGIEIPKDVERDYALRDYIDQAVSERTVPQKVDNGMSTQTAGATGQFDALSVVKTLNLETTDADVINLLKGSYQNHFQFEAEAAKLALRKLTKPAPSGAGSPPMMGGNGATELSDADKAAKFAKLDELYKTPTQKAAEIKVLEKELGMV